MKNQKGFIVLLRFNQVSFKRFLILIQNTLFYMLKNKQHKPFFTILVIASIVFCLSSCGQTEKMLNNNFEGWQVFGGAEWKFHENELIGNVKDSVGFVMTENTYQDFILELEFKPDSTINSGIYIRCQNKEISFTDCYEINIWDLHPNQDFRTGSVVNRATPLEYVETIGQWNSYKIQIKDDHIEAWINGIKTVDLTDDSLITGYIALQAMGTGEVSFRNVKIQDLSDE